jgi:hypothetical protein
MAVADFAATSRGSIIAAVSLKVQTDGSDASFIDGMNKQVASGKFGAVGEMLLYHAEKFDTEGNSVAPEHKVLPSDAKTKAVIEMCVKQGWPIVFHIEFTSLMADYGQELQEQYMYELKQLLKTYPDQAFVLTHVAELDPDGCRDLIEVYDNVYFTTSYKDLEVLCTGEPVENYSEEEWDSLLTEHSDRFIFTHERVWTSHWNAIVYSTDLEYFIEKISELPAEAAQAIACKNAQNLWKITVTE